MATITPTSPKADAPAQTEKKSAAKPTAFKPVVDTIDTKETEETSSFLTCLGNVACSIWSGIVSFFSWISSFFGADRELLEHPTKHFAAGVTAWKDPNGPLATLLTELRKHTQDPLATFTFFFYADNIPDRKSILTFQVGPIPCICTNQDAHITIAQDLLGQLAELDQQFKTAKAYVDFNRGDQVEMGITARFTTPASRPDPNDGTFNTLRIRQTFNKESVASPSTQGPVIQMFSQN